MDILLSFLSDFSEEYGEGLFLALPFVIFIGAVAKWRLFSKCSQPGIAAFIPIYDVVVTLRIVGRPASHIWLFLVPVYNIYFAFKLIVELVQSFGHFTMLDYIMAIVFNIFYILNLGLAYNEVYYGPVYHRSREEVLSRKPQLV